MLLLEHGEQAMLHALQQIEAHKHVVAMGKGYVVLLGHLAIECSFVGQLLAGEPVVEVVIDVAHA